MGGHLKIIDHKYFSHYPICLFLGFDFEKIRNEEDTFREKIGEIIQKIRNVDDTFREDISEITHKVDNLNINPATFNEFNKGSRKDRKRLSWICCMC